MRENFLFQNRVPTGGFSRPDSVPSHIDCCKGHVSATEFVPNLIFFPRFPVEPALVGSPKGMIAVGDSSPAWCFPHAPWVRPRQWLDLDVRGFSGSSHFSHTQLSSAYPSSFDELSAALLGCHSCCSAIRGVWGDHPPGGWRARASVAVLARGSLLP